MLKDIKYLPISTKVVLDNSFRKMIVINHIMPNLVRCSWFNQQTQQTELDDFLPESLSLLVELDTISNPHLKLLEVLLDDIFNNTIKNIMLNYHFDVNKLNSMCTCNISYNKNKPSNLPILKGLGSHVNWLWIFYNKEITTFIPFNFFNMDSSIILQKLGTNLYTIEYN